MASAGSLVAELSANTASFQRDLGKAAAILNSHAADMNRTIAGIERHFSQIGKAFGAALSVGAVTLFAKNVIDMGDQLSKTSAKLGISVEDLSAYQYAAKLAGTSSEDLTAGIAKLGKSIAEAITNPASDAAQAFSNLGLTTDDLKNKNLGKIFEDIAPKLAGISNETTRLQYETTLLGKTGYQLQPLLGSLGELSDEARRTGRVVSKDFAEASERFNDELSRMDLSMKTFLTSSSSGTSILDSFLTVLKSIEFVAIGVAQGFEELGTTIGALAAAGSAAAHLNFKDAKFILKELDADLLEIQKKGEAARSALFDVASGLNASPPSDLLPTSQPTPLISNKSNESSFLRLQGELRKATAEATAAINLDERAKSDERLTIASSEFALKIKLANLTADQQIQINDDFLTYQKSAAAKAAFDLRSPLQKLTDDWANTTKQMGDATAKWAQSSAEALTDFVTTGKADFKGLADSVIRDLVRIFIQQKVIGKFKTDSAAGSGLLGLVGGLFGGAYAHGGNPPIGKASLVGENGPEMIVPRSATTVIPNSALGGSVYNIDARGADREGLARLESMIRSLDGSIEHRAVSAWLRDRSRGGATAGFG